MASTNLLSVTFSRFAFWHGWLCQPWRYSKQLSAEAYGSFVATSAMTVAFMSWLMSTCGTGCFCLLLPFVLIGVFLDRYLHSLCCVCWILQGCTGSLRLSIFLGVLLLALVACMLPRWSAKCYQKMYRPLDVDIIREQVSMHQFDHLKNPEEEYSNDLRVSDLFSKESNMNSTGGSFALPETEAEALAAANTYRGSLERMSGERIKCDCQVKSRASHVLLLYWSLKRDSMNSYF